jgi:hypothetical protein
MTNKSHWGAVVWTTILSVTFALLLFPSIVGLHGIGMSLLYTGLGVGFIWFLFFLIGRLVNHAVSEELKRRGTDDILEKR